MTESAPSLEDIEAAWSELPPAPRNSGEVEWIVRRPVSLEREVLEQAELCPERGMVGDCWSAKPSKRTDDGGPHPEMQLTLINAGAIRAIAGEPRHWAPAGDQFYVSFDLSEGSLPAGTQLRIGEALIVITAEPHLGCGKFHQRFGSGALRWVNGRERRERRLRGVHAKVIEGGTVRRGDRIERIGS